MMDTINNETEIKGAGRAYADRFCENNALLLDIAAKDARIGQLLADRETDAKLVDVYKTLASTDKEQNEKIARLDKENAVMATKMHFVEGILRHIVSPAIKNEKVWPGWGPVTVAPDET